MSSLDELLASAKEAGIEIMQFCSLDCTNPATGEITVKDGDYDVVLPICDGCAMKMLTNRTNHGLDTVVEK